MKCHLYDENGALLYVGISLNAIGRLKQHGDDSHWFSGIAKVTIENFENRNAAAERRAIQDENPRYNGHHFKKPDEKADRDRSIRCESCERQLTADEPIWHLRINGRVRNVCRNCCQQEGWLEDQPPRPCQQCERPLHWSGRCPTPVHFVCSWECKRQAYWGDRYEPRPAPKGRACTDCGKRFYPKRTDAQFCSAACRQRAYRERQ